MQQTTVLIVERVAEISTSIRDHLERHGYIARAAPTGRAALQSVQRDRPNLIVLDPVLPDQDGLEVCRRLKSDKSTRDIPVLVVSGRGEELDIVAALEIGADDYITKPFSPLVLVARVRVALRRKGEAPQKIEVPEAGIVIDPSRHTVTVEGEPVELTLTQYQLLHYLASRPGHVRTRAQIVAAVRGESTVLSRRAVDVHVAALRQKLGSRAAIIETVRGVGYRLADAAIPLAV